MSRLPAERESKGISKKFLTPCRRVGLPRKKTPNNNPITPTLNNFENVHQENNSPLLNLETTPLSSNSSNIPEKSMQTVTSSSEVKDKKSKISKKLILDNETGVVQENPDIRNKNKQNSGDNEARNDTKKNKDDSDDFAPTATKRKVQVLDTDFDGPTANVKTKKNNKHVKEGKKFPENTINPIETPDSKSEMKNDYKKVKEANMTEKDNKKSENKAPDLPVSNETRKSEDHNLRENCIEKNVTHTVLQKTKKLRRSLSLKKTDDEVSNKTTELKLLKVRECSVNLTPVSSQTMKNHNILPEISTSEMEDLQKIIFEKRSLISELKQAEIYKKKHNLEELQKLTDLWRSGCKTALNDLLSHLQTHADMDMASLLKKLQLPESLISLGPTGELI